MSPYISMCRNRFCPLRLKCYRFIAKPNRWQSYSFFHPTVGTCDSYIPADGERRGPGKGEAQ